MVMSNGASFIIRFTAVHFSIRSASTAKSRIREFSPMDRAPK
jgi:hypothetical protein